MGRLSVNLTSPHLKVGAWWGQERQCFKKWNNDKNVTFGSSTLLSSVGGSCFKYAASSVQQVCEKEFTQRTRHTLPSFLSSLWLTRWCEKPQVSLMCLFRSISVTGRPGLPFVHRRGEVERTGPDQTRPDQTQIVWISPAPFGLITRPWSHRVLHHWGRSPPPREAWGWQSVK